MSDGAPRDDRDVAYKLGKLTEAVERLTASNDRMHRDIQRYRKSVDAQLRDLTRKQLFSAGGIATCVVAFWTGVVELLKYTL